MTRRPRGRSANGEGSIYQDDRGFWHGWITLGVKDDGGPDRRHRRGSTRQEVVAKLQALAQQRAEGSVSTPGQRPTVAQWLTYWLDHIATPSVTEGTLSGYRPLVERHIVPGLGKHRLDRLEPEHVEAFYRKLARGGMAPATILKTHRVLSRALKIAVQRNKLRRNVCTLVTAPSIEPREADALTAAQARIVLALAMHDRLAARWAFGLEVGCRQAEALGLQWSDLTLDLDRGHGVAVIRRQLRRLPARHGCGDPMGTVTVRHRGKDIERGLYPCGQAQPIRCPDRMGGGLKIIPYPKSKKPRRVFLSSALVLTLDYHRERQAAERAEAGEHWFNDPSFGDLVFRQASGRPIDPRRDYGAWTALLEAAEVPVGGTHKARHTAASLLLEAGVPAKVVQEVLGHASYRLTMDTYSHVSPPMSAEASERIEGLLWQ